MNERCSAKVIADSINQGNRLTTLELEYPRYIHGEFMTHRVFSRNAQSSRAIPIDKAIQRIREDEWYPIFMKNQPGMTASEPLTGLDLTQAQVYWLQAKEDAIEYCERLQSIGVHKQVASRVIEPFSKIKVLVSSTNWSNFFNLRIAKDAQQEMQELALCIKEARDESIPKHIRPLEYHLPYITSEDIEDLKNDITQLKKVSVARCARVSYLNHDKRLDPDKDFKLYETLYSSKHLSPFEHVATPYSPVYKLGTANFTGWIQLRAFVEKSGE